MLSWVKQGMIQIAGKTNHTKETIISQTIRMINEHGYQNISLRKLLGTLDLTTGAFYKHFSSKEDLFKHVTVTISKKFFVQASNHLAKGNKEDALQTLIDLGEFVIHQIETVPNLMDFLLFNPGIVKIYSQNFDDNSFSFLVLTHEIIHNLAIQHSLREPENDIFIKVWAFIQGYGSLIANGAITYRREFLALAATQLIGED